MGGDEDGGGGEDDADESRDVGGVWVGPISYIYLAITLVEYWGSC